MKKNIKASSKIINFYEYMPKKYLPIVENNNEHLHDISLPFRMCIVSPSGSGKTNFLANLIKIFSQGKGTFISIDIITANKDEPIYNYLGEDVKGIRIKEGMDSTPPLDSFDKQYNHLVVWDDMTLNKDLKMVENYYMRARKQNVSVIFLSQSYYDVPKFIRKNSNYLVILHLGGSKREETAILNESATDLNKATLKKIYNDATSENLRPLIITLGKADTDKKYRKGWKDYYKIKDWYVEDNEEPQKPTKAKSSRKNVVDTDSD